MELRDKVTDTAKQMAEEIGSTNITRRGLCEVAGISDGSWFFIMGETFDSFIDKLDPENDSPVAITKKRVKAAQRRQAIVALATELAVELGYKNVTRNDIAERMGVTPNLITHHFPDMQYLQKLVMQRAVRQRNVAVVAQGLALKDHTAMGADSELKEAAAKSLL